MIASNGNVAYSYSMQISISYAGELLRMERLIVFFAMRGLAGGKWPVERVDETEIFLEYETVVWRFITLC